MGYWDERNKEAMDLLTDKSIAETEAQLAKYYQKCMKSTTEQFADTYQHLLDSVADGRQPTPADLYKLDKYWQAQAQLQKNLQNLSDKTGQLFYKEFVKQYEGIYKALALPTELAFGTVDNAVAKQVINSIWCSDGKQWSQRIWENTNKLQQELNDKLIECLVDGKKTTELKQALMERFGVSYNRADTVVRTEMAHIQTESACQRYKDAGIERYEVLVSPDERTCDDCGEYDGQQFLLSEMVVGVNAPPFHPNCRDCIVPVI